MNPKQTLATAVVALTALAGGALGTMAITSVAGAQTTDNSAAATAPAAPSTQQAPPQGGHQGGRQGGPQGDPLKGGHVANGITETILTGDEATKVTDAANAAVPGGTVQRVETDAEGDSYEVHMTDASGKPVTVKLDASFNVTSTQDGFK